MVTCNVSVWFVAALTLLCFAVLCVGVTLDDIALHAKQAYDRCRVADKDDCVLKWVRASSWRWFTWGVGVSLVVVQVSACASFVYGSSP